MLASFSAWECFWISRERSQCAHYPRQWGPNVATDELLFFPDVNFSIDGPSTSEATSAV